MCFPKYAQMATSKKHEPRLILSAIAVTSINNLSHVFTFVFMEREKITNCKPEKGGLATLPGHVCECAQKVVQKSSLS
jgi:hypothetical protein